MGWKREFHYDRKAARGEALAKSLGEVRPSIVLGDAWRPLLERVNMVISWYVIGV